MKWHSWFLLLFLTNSISAQQASDHRAYFSTVIQSNHIYVIGGSNVTLRVPILNFDNGIDINQPEWLERTGPSNSSVLKPFEKGVAFQGYNDQVFVQGGEGASSTMQQLMRYNPSTDEWLTVSQQADFYRPKPSQWMTVSMNKSSHMAYFYGGQPSNSDALFSADFTLFDTNTNTWLTLNPKYPNATRPGRAGHTSNLVNNQLFIMGGITTPPNTTEKVEADFSSVLVYDLQTQTAAAIATLGEIPDPRQSFSTALGLDGRSIVMYGGHTLEDKSTSVSNDVYVLDTCTLTWTKKSVKGNTPGPLYGHGAVNINNYMVLLMGMVDANHYNERLFLLDLKNWQWVDRLDKSELSDAIAPGSCQFALPSFDTAHFYPYNYDSSILDNPLRTVDDSSKKKSTGFGVGFGLFGLLLVGGAWFYYRRVRKQSRSTNPRWTMSAPDGSFHPSTEYPMFVYQKESQTRASESYNNTSAPQGVQTYTATDHDQWEQQPSDHQAIWQGIRKLNDR
ncbi:hypothetical protein EDC96DRAFT_530529 [Choanephora cucurbitarum]|nr:hypothetical protein EDC96DRAFT_530529 [Choanephora cucurbitarum]